jgi:MFS superfamily sulfate permease-like transporter
MANATTAGLPPINGLYVAFFSVIAYLILGTSKHLSMGTHGVIALMVANVIKQYDGILYAKDHAASNSTVEQQHSSYLSDNPDEAKVRIAMMLAFQTGCIQVKYIGQTIYYANKSFIKSIVFYLNYNNIKDDSGVT